MGLLDQARKDIKSITTNKNDFAVDITFVNPDKSKEVTVQGIHVKHNFGIDQEGNQINTKTAHVTVSEEVLKDAGYEIRNSESEVDLNGHLISAKDSTGKLWQYAVQAWFPDEALGLIRITLEDYDGGED